MNYQRIYKQAAAWCMIVLCGSMVAYAAQPVEQSRIEQSPIAAQPLVAPIVSKPKGLLDQLDVSAAINAPSTVFESTAPKDPFGDQITQGSDADDEENSDSVAADETVADTDLSHNEVVEDEHKKLETIYLGDYVDPWGHVKSNEKIEFLFENAELSTLVKYIEDRYAVTFILDDSIKPLPQGGKSIMGTKISFKTNEPLSKKEAWNIFVTFLDMAGVTPVPGPAQNVYKLVPSQDWKAPLSAARSPLPTFIGTDLGLLPANDTRIRYVYFVTNTNIDVVKNVMDAMKSTSAPNLAIFPELQAIIITDKATNIRAILEVVKELDRSNTPEALSVVQLKRTDVSKAIKVYADLVQKDGSQGIAARLLGSRRPSTVEYFSPDTRVIPEPRTNRLIIIGTRESIQKVTEFFVNVIDQQDSLPTTPVYTYGLKFIDAVNTAKILQDVVKFQSESEAAKSGGVRDGNKFLRAVSINAEKTTNTLIINAEYEDYAMIADLLKQLDIEQPQIALKVFILDVDVTDNKGFGVQLRNKAQSSDGLFGNNVNFQTSGLADGGGVVNTGIVEQPAPATGSTRLLGDLVNLATGVLGGSTVVTLGSDRYGVWGILNMLETYSRVTVVDNPFLITTNKYPAQVAVGETRRVTDETIFGQTDRDTFKDLSANLDVRITPQISREGLITLDVVINIDKFTDVNVDSTDGNRTVKQLSTSVILADNEALALGGLIRDTITEATSEIPILGRIPLIGWLFKNKTKVVERTSLLILIVPEIIWPQSNNLSADLFTRDKIVEAKDMVANLRDASDFKDPINRWFFKTGEREEEFMDRVIETRGRYVHEVANDINAPPESAKRSILSDLVNAEGNRNLVLDEKNAIKPSPKFGSPCAPVPENKPKKNTATKPSLSDSLMMD